MWNCERIQDDRTEVLEAVMPAIQIGEGTGPGPSPCELVHIKSLIGEHLGSLVIRGKIEFTDNGFSAYGRQVEADEYGRIQDFPTENNETWNFSVVPE